MLMITSIEAFTPSDLPMLDLLKPVDWGDIVLPHQFYLSHNFCHSIKVCIEGKIAGIGTGIVLRNTGWLGHIIVHPDFRKQGIGSKIVAHLTQLLRTTFSCTTISLLATDLGFPVYCKAGFVVQSEYAIYSSTVAQPLDREPHPCISRLHTNAEHTLYALDQEISGEKREAILKDYVGHAYVYRHENEILGGYFPSLGEGLVVASNVDAGLALMALRVLQSEKICVPSENLACTDFLVQRGFRAERRIRRMVLGEAFPWKPACIYSRAAGYLG